MADSCSLNRIFSDFFFGNHKLTKSKKIVVGRGRVVGTLAGFYPTPPDLNSTPRFRGPFGPPKIGPLRGPLNGAGHHSKPQARSPSASHLIDASLVRIYVSDMSHCRVLGTRLPVLCWFVYSFANVRIYASDMSQLKGLGTRWPVLRWLVFSFAGY